MDPLPKQYYLNWRLSHNFSPLPTRLIIASFFDENCGAFGSNTIYISALCELVVLLVLQLASLTGKRWPIVGKRLHMEFPYIDAEVSPHNTFMRNLSWPV
jgi:hypothetical protein